MFTSRILGTGSYIPEVVIPNSDFLHHEFYEREGVLATKSNESIIEKFSEITGIKERRYARPDQNASDLGTLAAEAALANANIDRETLDYIIVAHNFGEVTLHSNRSNILPSLASRIKAKLKIENPDCVGYDVPFGCPGWVEAMIQANYYIRSGDAKRCLVIGAETLSRVVDDHDRDFMEETADAPQVFKQTAPATQSWGAATAAQPSRPARGHSTIGAARRGRSRGSAAAAARNRRAPASALAPRATPRPDNSGTAPAQHLARTHRAPHRSGSTTAPP